MSDPPTHTPVLPVETMTLLAPRPGEVAVDCTVGDGGHSRALLQATGPEGLVIGFDVDRAALADAARRLAAAGGRFEPVAANFVGAADELTRRGLRADVVLADLGFSSRQMDDPARGLGFAADGPLDMRFDPQGPTTAAELVGTASESELASLLHRFGEEPLARRIARAIVDARARAPIQTTARLAAVVSEAYGARAARSRMHPATRTFMALRIAVNEELAALDALLEDVARGAEQVGAAGWLNPGARVAIISFHSLEDRAVKQCFAALARRGLAEKLTPRPVTATDAEIHSNPRARSAKLRAVRLPG